VTTQTYLAHGGLQSAGELFGSADDELMNWLVKLVTGAKVWGGKCFVNAVSTFEIPGFKFWPHKSENQTEGKVKEKTLTLININTINRKYETNDRKRD
jgi:hypothetical protein